jgi:hypothetical protein
LDGKKVLDIGSAMESGKIVVVTVPSTTNRLLAETLAKLLKSEFYSYLQNRKVEFEDNSRLLGLIMDEFQLCATAGDNIASDSSNMQTIRSKKGFIVAATQGLIGLDCSIGIQGRRMLLVNFNNFFMFKSNENEVAQMCQSMIYAPKKTREIGFLADISDEKENYISENIESIPTGYAYVKLANGYQSKGAVKMKRLFNSNQQKRDFQFEFDFE